MRRMAEEHVANFAAADRAVLAAYARGVNYFIETHEQPSPITLLRYDLGLEHFRQHPVRTADVSHSRQRGAELQSEYAGRRNAAKVNFLFPSRIGTSSSRDRMRGRFQESTQPAVSGAGDDPHLEFRFALPV